MKTYATSIDYQNRGWAVFPLVPGGKIPATPDGFKSATKDHKIGEQWFKGTNYNIGVATGAVSGIVVLDIDRKSSGYSSLAELEKTHGSLPHTYRVRTGGLGAHYYFRHPGGTFRNKTGLRPGVDVRGDGGYVVAPPSVTDGPYELTHDLPLADMPPWLIEMCQEKPKKQVLVGNNQDVVEGGRNNYLTQVGGALQKRGLTIEALSAALHAENEARCHPPLPEWEVDTIIKSVSRYDADSPIEVVESPSILVTAAELVEPMLSFIKDKDRVKGDPTLVEGLDKLLGGGKRTGEVTCWHAEAKTGKNTFWHKLMHLWLSQGQSLGYASRELTPETEVLPNLLSLEFQENAWKSDIDEARGNRYAEAIRRWPLFFASGYGHFDLDEIKRWVAELRKKEVRFVWFDHLHYMLDDPEDHKSASKLIKEIKAMAKREDVHVDIIIQPNKIQDGQKLSLNSIKGGAAMGQAIDNLLILERVKDSEEKNVAKLTLEVGRSKLCKLGSLYLQYNPDTTDFVEVHEVKAEPREPEPPTFARPSFGNNFRINSN